MITIRKIEPINFGFPLARFECEECSYKMTGRKLVVYHLSKHHAKEFVIYGDSYDYYNEFKKRSIA